MPRDHACVASRERRTAPIPASKRPRHVPRDHARFRGNRKGGRRASKRPRHVPRDHIEGSRIPREWSGRLQRGRGTCLGITSIRASAVKASSCFKEAEARASGSPTQEVSSGRTRDASKRPRHVPRDHSGLGSVPGSGKGGFKEAEARASGSRRRSNERRASPRQGFKEAEARASGSRERRAESWRAERGASKRPRHVPRDHGAENVYRGNALHGFKEAEARASGSQGLLDEIMTENAGFKEAEARASGSPHLGRFFRELLLRASKRPRHVPRDHAMHGRLIYTK